MAKTIVRNTARVLLLNQNKLLLMRIQDFDIGPADGDKHIVFWCTVGGEIEEDETVEQAALREIYEETGISRKHIRLGSVVWFNEIDLMLKGKLTCFKESYIVAHTDQEHVALLKPTADERAVVKELKWFSMDEINDSKEVIFPVFLTKYLPDIIAGKYPLQTLIIR